MSAGNHLCDAHDARCSLGRRRRCSYRLMRASVFHAMFNFGLVAADGIIQKLAGWPMDMRTFSVSRFSL